VTDNEFAKLRSLQNELRHQVISSPLPKTPELFAAVDVHGTTENELTAVAVVTDAHGMLIDQAVVRREPMIPYVPGYLSFREMPVCVAAIQALSITPDVILADGQGIAHPRRFGLACHIGITIDIPTFGVAKSRLIGDFDQPDMEKGSTSPLMIGTEQIGAVVRTRSQVRPVFISVGHRITLDEAVHWTLKLATRFRLPEPSHQAHRIARDYARSASRSSSPHNH
jgi:deoxyribonuclease V